LQSKNTAAIQAEKAIQTTLRAEISTLEGRYNAAVAEIKDVEAKLRKTESQLAAEQKITAMLRSKIAEGVSAMNALRQEYTIKMAELEKARQKELEAIRSDSEAAIAVAKAETRRIEKELKTVEGKYTVSVEQNNALQKELTSTQQAKEDLETQLAAAQTSMTRLRREYTQKMAQLRTAQAKELEAVRSESAAQIKAARAETVRTQKELDAVEGKYKAAVSYSETLEVSLAKETRLKEEALAKFEDLKESITKITNEYGDKIIALQERKTELRQAYEAGKMSEVQYLRKLVESLENEITLMLKQQEATEKRVVVLEAQLELAIKERDANKQQNLRLVEEAKQLRDEYDRKIRALQTAQQKELLARSKENETLRAAAAAEQQKLQAEIKALEGRYNVATTQIKTLQGELQTERTLNAQLRAQLKANQEKMTQLRQQYETKIAELRASQQRELQALQSKNTAAIQAEKAIQTTLRAEISTLEGRYNAAVAEIKDLQQRGPKKSQSIYALIDSDSWMNQGVLRVLTMRNGMVSVRPFTYRDASQAWAPIDGSLRVLEGKGLYLSSDASCATPQSTTNPGSRWTFQPTSRYAREYRVRSVSCGRDLTSSQDEEAVTFGTGTWFAIPVGTTT
jgi:chromosome segregation ATPase